MVVITTDFRNADESGNRLDAFEYEQYLLGKSAMTTAVGLREGSGVDDMMLTQMGHKKFKESNMVFEIVQSWDHLESKILSTQEIHGMGKQLAERFLKGHDYYVITHTDKKHKHNHIYANPVNTRTGERIHNKLSETRDPLMKIANNIQMENGLSIIEKRVIDKVQNLPFQARKILKAGGQSYLYDLMQKADFARMYSTNSDQYDSTLKAMNIGVSREKGRVSYSYDNEGRTINGCTLGKRYDTKGLENVFEKNRRKFAQFPDLQEQTGGEIKRIKNHRGNIVGTPSELLLDGGGHEHFKPEFSEKIRKARSYDDRIVYDSDHRLHGSAIPVALIQQARNENIFKYLKKNKIKTETLGDGSVVLKSRKFVRLTDYEWTNTKNGTRGSLIDLVALHDNTTLLHAISKITGNSRVMLLEKNLGKAYRQYDTFHPVRPYVKPLKEKFGQLIAHLGGTERTAERLGLLKNVKMTDDGKFWFLPEDERGGAIEYGESSHQKWKRKKHGGFQSPFVQKSTKSRDGFVFFSLESFIKHKQAGDLLAVKHGSNILALMEHNEKHLDLFLIKNPHIDRLFLIPENGKEFNRKEVSSIELMNKRLKHHGITIEKSNSHLEIPQRGPELDISL